MRTVMYRGRYHYPLGYGRAAKRIRGLLVTLIVVASLLALKTGYDEAFVYHCDKMRDPKAALTCIYNDIGQLNDQEHGR